MHRESATSHTIGIILMVVITVILVAIIAAMILSMPLLHYSVTPIPPIITITRIESVDEITKQLTYDSRVILLHSGIIPYQNDNLKAQFYKNGVQVNANIATLNGHDFISTSHIGVQWIGYAGCSGATWAPGEMSAIDLNDGTFHPGDTAQIDIIDKSTNQVISRHSYLVK